MRRTVLRGVALAVVAMALAGCESYFEGAETRTAGEIVDDAAIHTQVKARLLADPDVRGLRIRVAVNQGVAEVTGKVRSDSERRRIVEIVGDVATVERVVDSLVLAD